MRAFLVSAALTRLGVSPRVRVAAVIAMAAFVQTTVAQEAQMVAPRPLITQAVDDTQLARLTGNTHPLARPEFDLGTAPATLPMERMLLVLKRGPEQEAALDRLMDDQQDKNSPSYHKWLTPEQFGQKFGPTDADLQAITGWLQSRGFQVGSTKGRTVLEFSGSASQVQEAFHTTIHKYLVNGEQHWANASDPSIPAALMSAVAGIASLNNFPRRPMNASAGVFKRDKQTGIIEAVKPEFTFPSGCVENNAVQAACFYGVGPWDFATIYDVQPLWNAGINGTGQTIAIVGESNINPQDVADFQSLFGLPSNPPNIILNGPDPGLQPDEGEADIDVQWSGSVAPKATIDFVVSQSTETTAGIDLSAVYIVENNLAPVMSESYGFCELGLGTAGNQFYNALWQQAAAQGITVFISAGDNGSAGCDDFNAQSPAPAKYGLQVSGFASTPYNVAVGGTDFNDFSNPATYWSTTNNSTTQASALSYIPEVPWNSSCTNPVFTTIGLSTNPETNCNDSRVIPNFVVPVGGSGGASTCTTPSGSTASSCAGGYTKPSWQNGRGVPADGKRDIPDVSLFASNGFLQSFYIVCQTDKTFGTCNLNSPYSYFEGFGGTSVSSPAFAGIMALVNQQYGRQGNANYVLYKLAAQQPSAFHDVTSGTIAMPCATGSPNCSTTLASDAYGVLQGYNAGVGYDLATGLGSVDANVLVTKWNSVTLAPSVTTLNSLTPTTITHGQAVNFSATVASQSGTGATPTGQVSLIAQPTSSTTQGIGGFALNGSGVASGSTEMLPGGTYSVTAHYPGDSTYAPSDSTGISVTVGKENSQPKAYLVTFNSNGTINNPNASTAVYGSSYLLRVDVNNAAGQLCSPIATTGATGCPSGTVALTNNGNKLDAGTYTLNSYGYVEDQTVQLPGGTDSVTAAYAGDESFNSSSATTPITITPASTAIGPLSIFNATVGQGATLSVIVNTTTHAATPSGTVNFFANGKALSGTTVYGPGGPGGPQFPASLQATLSTDTNAFPAPGSYTITETYSGDANYSSSTSAASNINVFYPRPAVTTTPFQQTVSYGGTATITAIVDTTNKSTYPTGTVTFTSGVTTLSGPTTCTNTTDANGNFACQAVASITVTSTSVIDVQYSGDANYPASSGGALISMPDFSIYPQGALQVTAGQSQSVTLFISGSNGYTGPVTSFACSGLPAETTCSFNPTSVTLPSIGTASTTLTVTTTAIGHLEKDPTNRVRATSWGLSQALILFGACFIAIPLSRRRGHISMALMLTALLVAAPGCGGGGGSGSGGGGGTPNPVPSISSLSPKQAAAGSQITGLTINGSNFMNSATVTFNGHLRLPTSISPTQILLPVSFADIPTAGQYPVVVTNPSPGGGASAPLNFSALTGTPTGSFNVTVTAGIAPLTHTTTLYMTVQ